MPLQLAVLGFEPGVVEVDGRLTRVGAHTAVRDHGGAAHGSEAALGRRHVRVVELQIGRINFAQKALKFRPLATENTVSTEQTIAYRSAPLAEAQLAHRENIRRRLRGRGGPLRSATRQRRGGGARRESSMLELRLEFAARLLALRYRGAGVVEQRRRGVARVEKLVQRLSGDELKMAAVKACSQRCGLC